MTDRWYDCRYGGLVRRSGSVPPRPHDPAVALWFGELVPWGPRRQPLAVGGAGWDAATAEAAAVGEAIERLLPHPLPHDLFLQASFRRWPLDEPAVDPAAWVLFHPDQYARPDFPYRPLDHDTDCRWVCFRSAADGNPWWVPEEMAFLYPRPGAQHLICPAVSTGLSCGRLGQPVLLRGLQEVLERDAVVGAWWGRYLLEEWDGAAILAGLGADFAERLVRPNLRYRWFRVNSPLSDHVTLVTLEGEDHEGYCHSVGSACRATRRDSWLKSALEAVQGRHYVRFLLKEAQRRPGPPLDFADHAVYFSLHPDRLTATPFAHASAPQPFPVDTTEDLAALTARLEGRAVLWRNVTPPTVAQSFADWYVLKVVVPGLQPLHGDDHFPHLGGPLWAPRSAADWDALPPHPFP